MRAKWQEVKFGEVLRKSNAWINPSPAATYKEVTVKLWGRGVVLRREVEGSEITGQRRLQIHRNQFILSRIDARNGATGLVPDDLEGALVTNDFPSFEVNAERLVPEFLGWLSKTKAFVESCRQASEGTTNRVRLKEDKFLRLPIALPPLHEQRRIVAKIERLTAKMNEAQVLRIQVERETAGLYSAQLAALMESHGEGWRRETVGDVILSMDAGWSPQCDDLPATEGQWGVLKTTAVQWCEFRPVENKALPPTLKPAPALSVLAGDVLVTRAGPRKRVGVVAAARKNEPWLTISDKIIRLRPDTRKIDPRFLELSLASPFSQEHLVHRKTGLADAQVNISQPILRATPVAYPPISAQRQIVAELDALQARVNGLKTLQANTASELDALLPSVLAKAFRGEL